jgi:hypothetical protein
VARSAPLLAAPGLAVASSADIYPEIVNGQAILGVAERVGSELLNSTSGQSRLAAA